MESTARIAVEAKRHVKAPPERVYDAWLDEKTVGKWLFTTPKGQMLRAEVDPRVGGGFVIVERRDDDDVEHVGEYLVLDRPRKIVFNVLVTKFSSVKSRVEVDIEPANGGSDVTILHDGVFQDFARRTIQGWVQILADLEAQLDGQAS